MNADANVAPPLGLPVSNSHAEREAAVRLSRKQYAVLVEQLRRSREELDHFVRALSHDMSANFMLLEYSFSKLKRAVGEPSHEVTELTTHVEACLRESRQFLRDLVNLAKTGRVEMEPAKVDLDAVVADVLFEQREPLSDCGVALEVRRPLGTVWCNEHRLKQIVTNLIRNAVRHGCDPQTPRIMISAHVASAEDRLRAAPSERWIHLRIHDNGPGIPPEFREEIFLPGRRLPQAAAEGSGMGLAIVRKIVEHYGGGAWVDPECREGTAIVVRLPYPRDDGLAHSQPISVEVDSSERRARPEEPPPQKDAQDLPHLPIAAPHILTPRT